MSTLPTRIRLLPRRRADRLRRAVGTAAAALGLCLQLAVGPSGAVEPGVVPASRTAEATRQSVLRVVTPPPQVARSLRPVERPTADVGPIETRAAFLQPVGEQDPGLRRVQPSTVVPERLPPLAEQQSAISKPITELTANVEGPAGEVPVDQAQPQRAPIVLSTPGTAPQIGAPFYSTPRKSNFYHRPLYFEERATERYGHSWGPAQPIVSGVHFFGTLPALPYAFGARTQQKRVYTGNGVNLPEDRLSPREHIRGAMTEAAFATGLIFALP
jgi:hypothetical protein